MRAELWTLLHHHLFPVCPHAECAVLALPSQGGYTQHWKCMEKGNMHGQAGSKALKGFSGKRYQVDWDPSV